MSRKYLTEMFPFLLPIRKAQKKLFFYTGMALDGKKYARTINEELYAYKAFETSSKLINENSGQDVVYQYNKVHNLKVAANALNGLIIKQGETFSFYQAIKNADKHVAYKDGLNLLYGNIVPSYGGGLCQLSSMLFWIFLNSPLTLVERHSHAKQAFPTTTEDLPIGTDAAVNEGWHDLKVRNDTYSNYQIHIDFDEEYMYGKLVSDMVQKYEYNIENNIPSYYRINGKVYQRTNVYKTRVHNGIHSENRTFLYKNVTEIGYDLPEEIKVIEREVQCV